MTPRFQLSLSIQAQYFSRDCETFLRYRTAGKDERAASGIPTRALDHNPLMQAVLASGYAWEEEVVHRHLVGKVLVAPGTGPLHEHRFTPEETLRLLRTLRPGRLICQATLQPSPACHLHLGLDPDLVTLADNHSDLIEVRAHGGRRRLRILEVKRGEEVQLGHYVQVLLYALELAAMLGEAGITDAEVDLDTGGVWLGGQSAYQELDLPHFRPHLEDFLRRRLPELLWVPAHQALYHFNYRCKKCDFCDPCQEEMRRSDDVSCLTCRSSAGPSPTA